MKQAAGLVLALAGASPALADGLGENGIKPRSDGLPTSAIANGQNADAALAEGRSLLAAGNAAQAISAFRLALGQDAGSVAALNGIAIAYDRLGRIDLARQHFEMALALEPDAGDIAYNLGWTLHRSGRHRDAIAWLQRASSGLDGRAAAAARRALLLVAAALEQGAVAPAPSTEAPVRVASARIDIAPPMARIDIAGSGEAVLVLPGAVNHPAAAARVVVAQRAGGVPTARIADSLTAPATGKLPPLAAPVTQALQETPPDMVVADLGDLQTLTIPMATLTLAEAKLPVLAPGAAAVLLPQVINIGEVPPDFSPVLAPGDSIAPLPALAFQPLRLLDLAALPELATATPLAPRRFIAPAAIAIDWLAGFDATRFGGNGDDRAYLRLVTALSAQADPTAIDDRDAVRLAIARLEALVARIGTLSA